MSLEFHRLARIAPLLAASLAGGCANLVSWDPPPQREVHNQQLPPVTPERPVASGEYMVQRGDTMYSIAFRNNLDYRELARWNAVGSDYLIRPGQVLRLSAPPQVALVEGDVVSYPTQEPPPPSNRPTPLPVEAPTIPIVPGAAPAPRRPRIVAHAPPSPVEPVVRPTVPPPPVITSESGGPYKWQWPTQGDVVRAYNPGAGSKGLDFAGKVGQPVFAAAPGKVVYSGSALKGYGELIIIKHDDLRLSAYGYNRTRLVNEGQMVSGGQHIAELGLGPENKPILHFEIRERGQPVNPVPYLPPR
ncbi:peptidoglycan DD-metalloendopeptidase family protein [Panacagrimonas sp.]|uniref:peptidoglycan DD-metalloendopeptidase family protein n=1 Tax=Panacagrimonas sp. TaxID=2480088 RepID=UPI003B5241FB